MQAQKLSCGWNYKQIMKYNLSVIKTWKKSSNSHKVLSSHVCRYVQWSLECADNHLLLSEGYYIFLAKKNQNFGEINN